MREKIRFILDVLLAQGVLVKSWKRHRNTLTLITSDQQSLTYTI